MVVIFLILKNTELIKILKQEKRDRIDSEDFNFMTEAEIQFPKDFPLNHASAIASLSLPDGSMGLSFLDDKDRRVIVISYSVTLFNGEASETFVNLALYGYDLNDKQWSVLKTAIDAVELGRIPFSECQKPEGKFLSKKAMSCIKRCSTLKRPDLARYLKSLE